MPLDFSISDDALNGFSHPAKGQLEAAVLDYSEELIEEANRIESGRNTTDGPVEVTQAMVTDAQLLLARGLGTPRRSGRVRLLRIAAAVLSLAAGLMYDKTQLQDSVYVLVFVVVLAAAILAVTVSALKE